MLFGILAETVEVGINTTNWAAFATSLTSTGFAVWCAWYLTAKHIPAKETAHRQEREKTEAAHREEREKSESRHEAHIQLLIANSRSDKASRWQIKREDDMRLTAALREIDGINRPTGVPI